MSVFPAARASLQLLKNGVSLPPAASAGDAPATAATVTGTSAQQILIERFMKTSDDGGGGSTPCPAECRAP
jgi:hypothetical protein